MLQILFHNIKGMFILNVQIDLKKCFDKKRKKSIATGGKFELVKNFGG